MSEVPYIPATLPEADHHLPPDLLVHKIIKRVEKQRTYLSVELGGKKDSTKNK
jgi:hypothetical protein